MQKIRKITTISCIKIHTPYILGCSDAEGCEFDPRRVHHQDTRKRSVRNPAACVFSMRKCPFQGFIGIVSSEKELALKIIKADGRPLLLSVVDFFGIHIVVRKPVPGYLFPFGPLFSVVAIGVNGDSAAWQKLAEYFDISGIH